MRRLSMILLSALALALVACQDDQAKLAQHLERGEQYIEEKKYAEAIIELKSALQIDPNHGGAHYKLAHAYFRTEKPRDGFWELRETVRLDPANHDARVEFSQLAILAGEEEEALNQMESMIADGSTDVRAYLVRGQALVALKRFDESLEVYQQAYALAPEDESALRAIARAEQRAGNKDTALDHYNALIEQHPNFTNFSTLARVVPRLMEDQDAGIARREELLRKGIEAAEGEDRPRAYELMTSFLINRKRQPEAFSLLEAAADTEEEPVPILYLLARLHRAEGDPAKADGLLERAAETRPDDPQVHLVLASYRVRQEEFDEALVSIDRALELSPDDKRARLQKAEVLMELGFRHDRSGGTEEARKILDQILAEEPSNAFALVADAKYKLGTDDLEGATRGLRAALESQPNWAEAYYLLGLSLAAQQDYASARNEFAKSLELDANQVRAKAALAEVHFRLGEWAYCVDRATEYLAERPEDNQVRLLKAQSLVRLGRMDEAKGDLAAIPDELRSGEVYFALGRIAQGEQDLDGARANLLEANERLPGNWEVLQALLVIDRMRGSLDESKQRIAAALAANPENGKLHQLTALVAYNEGRIDDAEAGLKRAIELDPDDLQAYQRLARLYAQNNRLEETTSTYEKALEQNPNSPTVNHFLGVLYELSGDKQRAVERYEAAIENGPQMAEAKNNLAYLYAELDTNLDRALDLAQDAKAQLPENPSVSDTLGWVLFKRGVPSAAVSYLEEAVSRTQENDASRMVILYHLAMAHEANGDAQDALEAVDQALGQLDAFRSQAPADSAPPEPEWAPEARALKQRVTSNS